MKIELSKGIVKRKRGNPQWGRPQSIMQKVTSTEWELLLKRLNINPDDNEKIIRSHAVREFISKHKNTNYIPEWALKHCGYDISFIAEDGSIG